MRGAGEKDGGLWVEVVPKQKYDCKTNKKTIKKGIRKKLKRKVKVKTISRTESERGR